MSGLKDITLWNYNKANYQKEYFKFLRSIIMEYSDNIASTLTDVPNCPVSVVDKAFTAQTSANVSLLRVYVTRELMQYLNGIYKNNGFPLDKGQTLNINKTARGVFDVFQKILDMSRSEIFLSHESVRFITSLSQYYKNDNNVMESFLKFYLIILYKSDFYIKSKEGILKTCFLEILTQILISKANAGANVTEIIESLVKFNSTFDDEDFLLWFTYNDMQQLQIS